MGFNKQLIQVTQLKTLNTNTAATRGMLEALTMTDSWHGFSQWTWERDSEQERHSERGREKKNKSKVFTLNAKDYIVSILVFLQNHWFTYNETMTVESVTQAVSNLALQFGEEDADPGAMVRAIWLQFYCTYFQFTEDGSLWLWFK